MEAEVVGFQGPGWLDGGASSKRRQADRKGPATTRVRIGNRVDIAKTRRSKE
jgi:hypothetical protein